MFTYHKCLPGEGAEVGAKSKMSEVEKISTWWKSTFIVIFMFLAHLVSSRLPPSGYCYSCPMPLSGGWLYYREYGRISDVLINYEEIS